MVVGVVVVVGVVDVVGTVVETVVEEVVVDVAGAVAAVCVVAAVGAVAVVGDVVVVVGAVDAVNLFVFTLNIFSREGTEKAFAGKSIAAKTNKHTNFIPFFIRSSSSKFIAWCEFCDSFKFRRNTKQGKCQNTHRVNDNIFSLIMLSCQLLMIQASSIRHTVFIHFRY